MDKNQSIKIARQYADLLRTKLPIKKVLLYGSYANGHEKEYSDIDIAIIVDEIKDDYLEQMAELCELGWKIDSRIEPVLLKEGFDESGFYESILEHGIIAYDNDEA